MRSVVIVYSQSGGNVNVHLFLYTHSLCLELDVFVLLNTFCFLDVQTSRKAKSNSIEFSCSVHQNLSFRLQSRVMTNVMTNVTFFCSYNYAFLVKCFICNYCCQIKYNLFTYFPKSATLILKGSRQINSCL